jgi:drug/metabolite transporter (DMT)-like permease
MKTKNAIILLITAFIWGTAFVAQAVGASIMQPFTFNGVRSLMGGVALLPCIWLIHKFVPKTEEVKNYKKKDLLIGGGLCGLLMFSASTVQQFGIVDTTAGKAGFITTFYIILVPIMGIFLKKKTNWKVWISVAIALVGLYFLCIKGDFSIGKGDILVFIAAIIFAIHVLVIDYFSPKVEGVKMACMQFFITGILSIPPMFLTETPRLADIHKGLASLLFAGILSCAVAYTLQIIGQKGVDPTKASLIMSLEAVFSVLAGFAVLHEQLTMREGLGCVLMFSATMLAQLPSRKKQVSETKQSLA